MIRKCVEAAERGDKEIEVWGTGAATREFLYVEDAADAIVLAAERYEKADPMNLGSGQEISIRELVDTVRELTGYRGEVRWDATMPDGQPRRCLDTSRAERELGWRARTPFREGLRRTMEWFEASRERRR